MLVAGRVWGARENLPHLQEYGVFDAERNDDMTSCFVFEWYGTRFVAVAVGNPAPLHIVVYELAGTGIRLSEPESR